MRNQFHEIDGYLQVSNNIALIGYYGREFINANRKTALGNILDSNNQFNPKRGKEEFMALDSIIVSPKDLVLFEI